MNRLFKIYTKIGILLLVFSLSNAYTEERYTINLKEANLKDFINEISMITGRSIAIDERIRDTPITVTAEVSMDKEGVYRLTEAVLRAQGYAVIDDGNILRVVALASARAWAYTNQDGFASEDKFVTRVIFLKYMTSADASRVFRQLISTYAHLAPLNTPNALIVSDHAGNVQRIVDLSRQLDVLDKTHMLVLPLKHAWVREVALTLQAIHPDLVRTEATNTVGLIAFANENNNTLFLRGTTEQLAIVSETVAQLDQPYSTTGFTRIFPLQYTQAEDIAQVLSNIWGNISTSGTPGQTGINQPSAVSAINIQADASNNAIVARGIPSRLSEIELTIQELDVPKHQVLIEAAIVEVSADINTSVGVELGATDESGQEIPLATTTMSGILTGLLGSLVGSSTTTTTDTSSIGARALGGLKSPTLAIAQLDPDGVSFGAIISALTTHSKADLLSTPSVIALDNFESKIFIGQTVPFRTGTIPIDGAQGLRSSLSSIERGDVGIELKVTPIIRDDLSVQMKVFTSVGNVEVPALGIGEAGFGDIVTNKRSIDTTVVANNRQTIVLGGLIRDDVTQTIRRVPLLSNVPLLGRLFRNTLDVSSKRHLLVFLRPTIFQDDRDLEDTIQRRRARIWQLKLDGQDSGIEREPPPLDEIYEGRP